MSKRLSARVSLAALAVGAAALVPAAASAQGYYYGRPGYDARCEQYREGRTGAGARAAFAVLFASGVIAGTTVVVALRRGGGGDERRGADRQGGERNAGG